MAKLRLGELPSWLPEYIGLPYNEMGADREAGVNCWTLPRMIYREQTGISFESYVGGFEIEQREKLFGQARASGEWVPVQLGAERCLDLAIMETPVEIDGRWEIRPAHIGIVIARGTILDIEKGKHSWAWSYDTKRPRYRIVELWRHKDLA